MAFEIVAPGARIWRPLGLYNLYLPAFRQSPVNDAATFAHNQDRAIKQPVAQRQAGEPVQTDVNRSIRQMADEPDMAFKDWPEIWQDQFNNTKKAKLAWTYWSLGTDLMAIRKVIIENEQERAARIARLEFLRKFFKDLGLPSAVHTFWPPHLEHGVNPQGNPRLFWAGVKALGCRGAIIMGSPAARALCAKKELQPLSHFMEKGILVWILWDIETFARKRENYERMLVFLKKALSPFTS